MRKKNKRGQSTVEYVLLVTAVVAVIIAVTTGNHAGGVQNQLCAALGTAADDMTSMGGNLAASHVPAQPSTCATDGTPPYNVTVNVGG